MLSSIHYKHAQFLENKVRYVGGIIRSIMSTLLLLVLFRGIFGIERGVGISETFFYVILRKY